MSNSRTVSAPGKLMLMGEHAVVYGYPCLVAAVDKRLYVTAETVDGRDEVIAPGLKETRFVEEAVGCFRRETGWKRNVRITTAGDFTHKVGLGSSSAVTVACFKALSLISDIPLTNRQLFDLGYRVTLAIQGVGSGFDIAAAVFGGVLYYVYGGKTISEMPVRDIPLVVGYSGVKADTPTIIRQVAGLMEKNKSLINSNFSHIEKLVKSGRRAMEAGDYPALGKAMTENHRLLVDLGVSIPKLDRMAGAAISAGAWGAKLSGAGGGDCMIALCPSEKIRAVEEAIEEVGGEIIRVGNSAQGVREEDYGK